MTMNLSMNTMNQPCPSAVLVAAPIKPRRPLSAYNLFFAAERQKMIAERDAAARSGKPKIGFSGLAKTIAARWNKINPQDKAHFDELAREEKIRYKKAVSIWKKAVKAQKKLAKNAARAPSSSSSTTNQEATQRTSCASMDSQASLSSTMMMNSNNNDFAAAFEQQNAPWNNTNMMMMNSFQEGMEFFPQQQAEFPSSFEQMENVPLSTHSVKMLNQGIDNLAQILEEDCVDFFVSMFE